VKLCIIITVLNPFTQNLLESMIFFDDLFSFFSNVNLILQNIKFTLVDVEDGIYRGFLVDLIYSNILFVFL